MCGVFGIRAPDRDVARVTYFGLFALQHRGQESAGIAVSDRGRLTVLRDMGLVAQVFNEQNLSGLQGEVAIGHTRYSTTGSTHWTNAQPTVQHGKARTVTLGHNGNLTNVEEVREQLAAEGVLLSTTSDTEAVAALILFEFIYLARPDSTLSGMEVHAARVRMGERLAEEAGVEADFVLPAPDSGTPAAIGFARRSGIPFSEGLIKNRYVGRTFIEPEQGMREQGIRMKINPLAEVDGKRLVRVRRPRSRRAATRAIPQLAFRAR